MQARPSQAASAVIDQAVGVLATGLDTFELALAATSCTAPSDLGCGVESQFDEGPQAQAPVRRHSGLPRSCR